ncbi:hypothetical protein AB0L70_16845 [Kribbella sp. NPDC051952]|uniref:hypothetical protein n=1 Tax=Kribbella sp. NPDC051952 TaxID=3154851 RepID=UPI00342F391D
MSKFLGFLLGVVVALAGPAVFGVLAAPGGIELNAKEMALAFGIGALVFWAVVSYFSGAGALGAFIAFATLIYCWLWIPNRTTNFLNDVPGVTTGMIDGTKQYTLNGVVPILAVISLVYAIQLIVRGVQRRRRQRAEEDRLQREQDAAQAQQEADVAAVYPVAGSTYPEAPAYGGGYGNSTRYDDLFDDEPEPVRPRNQAEEQTSQYPTTTSEQTREFAEEDAAGNDVGEETVLVPTNADETVQVPTKSPFAPEADSDEEVTQAAARPEVDEDATQLAPRVEPEARAEAVPAAAHEVAAPDAPRAPDVEQEEDTQVAQAPEGPANASPPAPSHPASPAAASPPASPPAASPPAASSPASPAAASTPAASPQAASPAGGSAQAEAVPDAAHEVAAPEAPRAPEGEEEEDAQVAKAPAGRTEGSSPDGRAEGSSPDGRAEGSSPAGRVEGSSPDGRAEGSSPDGRVEMQRAPVVGAKEQVGSQYRERMDNPEDTGEFHLTAFENPVVRPAGA